MSILKPLLAKHHDHCDRLFAAAENAANDNDWATCRSHLEEFARQLELHFKAEEEQLFPAFEQATGMSGGPTEVMRGEHAQMRSLLTALRVAAAGADADDYFGAVETMVIFMEQHNCKEEGILYPMCDERIPDPGALADRLGLTEGA